MAGRGCPWTIGLVALLAGLTSAVAQPTAMVRWRAPDGCPSPAAVAARVDARLDRPLAVGDAIDADVVVVREPTGYRAHLTIWTPIADDVRELAAADCGAVADAAAVVVARAVAEARARTPVAPTPVMQRPTESEAKEPPPVPAPPEARTAEWSVGARLAVGADGGVVPRVGTSGELAVIVRHGVLATELAGRHTRPELAELMRGVPIGASVGLDALTVRLCGQWPGRGPRACAILENGTMTGTGVGLTSARSGSGRWTAAGLGVTVRAPVRRWGALVGTFEVVHPLDAPRFVLEHGTILYRSDSLCGRVALGVELSVF